MEIQQLAAFVQDSRQDVQKLELKIQCVVHAAALARTPEDFLVLQRMLHAYDAQAVVLHARITQGAKRIDELNQEAERYMRRALEQYHRKAGDVQN
jgi:cell division protein FtsB